MKKDKGRLNAARARMLRRLFNKQDRIEKELARLAQAQRVLINEFSKEAGFLINPGRERIRKEVFRTEYD